MSAFCEVGQGVGDKWATCPALLRSIWARNRKAVASQQITADETIGTTMLRLFMVAIWNSSVWGANVQGLLLVYFCYYFYLFYIITIIPFLSQFLWRGRCFFLTSQSFPDSGRSSTFRRMWALPSIAVAATWGTLIFPGVYSMGRPGCCWLLLQILLLLVLLSL